MANLVEAIDLYLKRHERNNKDEQYGEIVAVSVGTARVRIKGSNQLQEAGIGTGITAESGDFCVLVPNRSSPRPRWTVSQIIGNRNTGSIIVQRPYEEIFPPANIRTFPGIVGGVMLMWDTPVTVSNIQFQVQASPDESEVTAELTIGGSYAIIETATSLFLRVRSIAPDGQTSSWSEWLEAFPVSSLTTDFGQIVTAEGHVVVDPETGNVVLNA